MWMRFSLALLLGVGCVLGACQSTSGSTGSSHEAVAQEDSIRWATYSRQPFDDRQAGVERLLVNDAESFWRDAAAQARQIDDWPMIRLLCEKAVESNASEALPWLVRSWAMTSKLVADGDRPEREAIAAITGQPAERLLMSVVFDDSVASTYQPATHVAAWTVLVRVESHAALREQLQPTPDAETSVLVSMLQRTCPALDLLPADRLAIGQMLRLQAGYDQSHWDDWARWRQISIRRVEPATLALRHLPAIQHREASRDGWSRARWLDHIESRLAGRRFASRGDGADDEIVIARRPDRFEDHVDALGIADLLVIDHLLDAMSDPAVRRALFEQAEADRLDTRTEYGGAVVWDEQGKLAYKPFAPLLRRHDQAYIAPTACMEAVYLGLTHVHFHTQRYDNRAWAGPGKGDLDFAQANHVNAIVLTYLDADTLNVDAYFPNEVIVDLGCIVRERRIGD